METSPVPARTKRGCLWYAGVTVVGVFGLLAVLVAALVISVLNEPNSHSIVVSTDNQTYLEAETSNHGEGFLDGYDWLDIYYVRRSWFSNKRVKVYERPHTNSYNIGFRRRIDSNGQLQIEVKRPVYNGFADSTVLTVFVPPDSFPEK